ncbi:MAG TPA: energy transducer TonB [Candidatus Limnocylindrales bacterium]|nr:energy transducer TonB [Candidatus Limnocylindrales bacterium]
MFRESLLESYPAIHPHKRWPMAAAFTLELIAASVILVLPLASTGVIPILAAHPPRLAPVPLAALGPHRATGTPSGHPGPASASAPAVITLANNMNAIHFDHALPAAGNNPDWHTVNPGPGGSAADVITCSKCEAVVALAPRKPLRISHLSEALLVRKVEPVYPRAAVIINLQGEVKLHAIIARDGSIQSLNVLSGHPLLVQAAVDAVKQWRYRPYFLNGQAVEVETYISVNFRK